MKEYNARTQNYLKGKMPKERREQTIWRLKKMVRLSAPFTVNVLTQFRLSKFRVIRTVGIDLRECKYLD